MTAWEKRRLAQISEEIRRYPGPIARCDEHLTALLEERAALMNRPEQQPCGPHALWVNDGGSNAA